MLKDVQYFGIVDKTFKFLEERQLLDAALWNLLVKQYRQKSDTCDLGWRGEYWGKLMRGACLTYQYTKNEVLYGVLEATVEDLLSTQDTEGRFSTYEKDQEFSSWDMWCRKYVLVGLQYFLEICQSDELSKRILIAAERHTDYIVERIGDKEKGKLPITSTSVHWGGVNSSSILKAIVKMYELIGKKSYLDFAKHIIKSGAVKGFNIFEAACKNEIFPYEYPIAKAYETISCFEGLFEYAKVTGEKECLKTCNNFAEAILASDLTIVGGTGWFDEYFDNSKKLQSVPSGMHMQETCVSVSIMLYFTELLNIEKNARYADAIETIFYNVYLGSVNSDGCREDLQFPFDSYSPLIDMGRGLKIGGFKDIAQDRYYGCCVAIGAAGIGVLPHESMIAYGDDVCINNYICGKQSIATASGTVAVSVETGYPFDGTVAINVKKANHGKLYLRIPAWASEFKVSHNGQKHSEKPIDGYLSIDGVSQGDKIVIEFMQRVKYVSSNRFNDFKNARFALCYGPIILATDNRIPNGDAGKYDVIKDSQNYVNAEITVAQINEQIAFKIPLKGGAYVNVVDYASAGKDWDNSSAVTVWLT